MSNENPEPEVCTNECKPGIAGPGTGQFDRPVAVAANEASGDFYVLDEGNGRVERFSASGKYLGEFDGSGSYETDIEGEVKIVKEEGGGPPTGPLDEPKAIAVDNACVQLKLEDQACEKADPSNGYVYVADGFSPGHKVIDKFTTAGKYVGQVSVPLVEGAPSLLLAGLAVDRHGDLWVSEEQGLSRRGFDKFDNEIANEFLSFVDDEGLPMRLGLAVGPEEDLYAQIRSLELPFEVTERFTNAGQVVGTVENEPSTGVGVEWSSGNIYVARKTSVHRFSPASPPVKIEAFGDKGELTDGRGLSVNSNVVRGVPEREGPVYVADGSAADVVVFPLERPKPPTIDDVFVSRVTSESASLGAILNPRGAPTEYLFKYGPCSSEESCGSSAFDVTIPGTVGSSLDFEAHEVVVHLQNLTADAVYHFRAFARNGQNAPEDYIVGSEVVFRTQAIAPTTSPVDGRNWEMVSPASKHGTRVKPVYQEDVIQAAAGGDAFTYVTASPTEDEPKGYSNEAQVLARRTAAGWTSEDLGLSHSRATGQSIGEGLEYRWFSEDLSTALVQPFGQFEPATSSEATEQTPYLRSDFQSSDVQAVCTVHCYRPLVTASNVTEGVQFGEEGLCPEEHFVCGPRVRGSSTDGQHVIVSSSAGLTEGSHGGLYEWTDGVLTRVSILPSGSSASGGVELGRDGVTRGAVSNDGSAVVWSQSGGEALYLRNLTSKETVQLNEGLPGTSAFQAASADGARVFFTVEGELYVYEATLGKALRLTVPLGAEEKTHVQGKIVGISEDGDSAYFVANGRLSEEAQTQGTCSTVASQELDHCYLYEIQNVAGVWGAARMVAELSGFDFTDFAAELPGLTARVSPNGRWLVFVSERSLTGYNNRDAASGVRDEEVYLFDSASNRLRCVSCAPSGARPNGVEARHLQGSLVVGFHLVPNGAWLAGIVPGWTPYKLGLAFYQPRFLLNDGRVFFDGSDALVSGDVNGTEDVYEFEPVGAGSCTATSVEFVERENGCVGLVSSGTSREESAFLDASASGTDVFFLTASRLVSTDFDSALDVYDAHECNAGTPCVVPGPPPRPPCATEASCKPSPGLQPDIFGQPASSTFSGLGNVPPLMASGTRPVSHKQLLAHAVAACERLHPKSRRRSSACKRRAHARFAVRRSRR